MKKILFPILSLLLIGCQTPTEDNSVYFGGKIINPKGDYVLLYNHDHVIDSIKITKKNTFSSKIDNLKQGLYFFKHGNEHQYVYLEPKDSLLLRLNTWDFDESLVFSGTNAERNNIMIETFLQNEVDSKTFYKFHDLSQGDFKDKIDSIEQDKRTLIDNYKRSNNENSSDFLSFLESYMMLPLYTRLENYVIENSLKETPEQLNPEFTAYRTQVNINTDSLMFFAPFSNYVYANLYSEVYQKKFKSESDDFTVALLTSIDEKIGQPKIKNKLLRQTTIRHFYNKSKCKISQEAFDTFLRLSTNDHDKEVLSKLLNDVKLVKDKTKLPSFTLIGADGGLRYIEELTENKKAVLYFRNKKYSSDDWVLSRINYLKAKYPNTAFLVININNQKHQFIKNLNIRDQYYLNQNSDAHKFLTSKFPRLILVNDKGLITNGFGALSSNKIEKQIAEL